MPVVHCVLRLSGHVNTKARPSWFTKEGALASLLAAADYARTVGHDVCCHVLLDSTGPALAPPVTALLAQVDTVEHLAGGSARRSWAAMLDWFARAGAAWHEDDLVYLVEDDHVHRADALHVLLTGTADYRLLYCLPQEHDVSGRGRPYVGWCPVDGGVSSFAASVATLRRDLRTLRTWSYGAGAWDELTWRVLGAEQSAPAGYLRAPLAPGSPYRGGQWRWGVWHTGARAAALVVAALRRRPRSIEAYFPNPATHAEAGRTSDGTDWGALATEHGSAS